MIRTGRKLLPAGCEGGSWTGDRIYILGSVCLCALHSGAEQIFPFLGDTAGFSWAKERGTITLLEGCGFLWWLRGHPRVGIWDLWGPALSYPALGGGALPAPTVPVGSKAGCEEGTFHLSLVMPSVAWQSRAEVMLHMAHSLLSAGNASFEILERGKVTLHKPRSGGPPVCLRPGWVSICLCRRQPCSVWPWEMLSLSSLPSPEFAGSTFHIAFPFPLQQTPLCAIFFFFLLSLPSTNLIIFFKLHIMHLSRRK